LAPHEKAVRNIVPFISTAAALVITPAVSLLTAPGRRDMNSLWTSFRAHTDAAGEIDTFHLIPTSLCGRIGVAVIAIGFVAFAVGIVSAHWAFAGAATMAISGMLAVLAGGLLRAFSD
jgi:hypothetical protein